MTKHAPHKGPKRHGYAGEIRDSGRTLIRPIDALRQPVKPFVCQRYPRQARLVGKGLS